MTVLPSINCRAGVNSCLKVFSSLSFPTLLHWSRHQQKLSLDISLNMNYNSLYE
jgi:hypothetical protein